ncbi:nodulation S family protein [Acidovorax sp. LjRoot118]|uniref:SAM-dependent methyltransferase n=1 Tax=unclassified Acidovorax TaxID=2684926 RepID=UPI00071111A1|nr:SAM-dependent methyltransferase [Acidovorax sp. Root217]KRC24863.1 methyltransferase [Acidovorax sp. Root217]
MTAPAPQNFFDPLFARGPDPWHFEGSWYEARKRDLLLASLPHARYESIFEPGCAGGFVSEFLAQRCDRLLAWDGAVRAVEYTANRLKPFAHAQVAQGWVPNQWPEGRFELIVLGEFLYYLQETDIERLAQRCRATLLASGSAATVASCHWLHPFDSFPLGGARVHEIMHGHLQMPRLAQWRDADFCLEIWSSARQSVAQREGRRE